MSNRDINPIIKLYTYLETVTEFLYLEKISFEYDKEKEIGKKMLNSWSRFCQLKFILVILFYFLT